MYIRLHRKNCKKRKRKKDRERVTDNTILKRKRVKRERAVKVYIRLHSGTPQH